MTPEDVVLVGHDCEHVTDEAMAGAMLFDLCQAYPGHAWFITIKGGVVFIKDLDLNDKWGMCLHYTDIKADAKERKRDVIRSAGEFLERANIARGRKSERQVLHGIDGVPEKYMARVGL